MRHIFLTLATVTASTVAFAVTVPAADIARPVYKAPPPVPASYNWTGFYLGANLGGGWGHEFARVIQRHSRQLGGRVHARSARCDRRRPDRIQLAVRPLVRVGHWSGARGRGRHPGVEPKVEGRRSLFGPHIRPRHLFRRCREQAQMVRDSARPCRHRLRPRALVRHGWMGVRQVRVRRRRAYIFKCRWSDRQHRIQYLEQYGRLDGRRRNRMGVSG